MGRFSACCRSQFQKSHESHSGKRPGLRMSCPAKKVSAATSRLSRRHTRPEWHSFALFPCLPVFFFLLSSLLSSPHTRPCPIQQTFFIVDNTRAKSWGYTRQTCQDGTFFATTATAIRSLPHLSLLSPSQYLSIALILITCQNGGAETVQIQGSVLAAPSSALIEIAT